MIRKRTPFQQCSSCGCSNSFRCCFTVREGEQRRHQLGCQLHDRPLVCIIALTLRNNYNMLRRGSKSRSYQETHFQGFRHQPGSQMYSVDCYNETLGSNSRGPASRRYIIAVLNQMLMQSRLERQHLGKQDTCPAWKATSSINLSSPLMRRTQAVLAAFD